jgi:hypothetical protein
MISKEYAKATENRAKVFQKIATFYLRREVEGPDADDSSDDEDDDDEE